MGDMAYSLVVPTFGVVVEGLKRKVLQGSGCRVPYYSKGPNRSPKPETRNPSQSGTSKLT